MSYPDENALSEKPIITNTEYTSTQANVYIPPQLSTIPQNTQPIVQTETTYQSNNLPSPVGPYVQPQIPIIPINNQVIPVQQQIILNPQNFKTTPVFCTCPNCKNNVTTRVEVNLNVANCCCCFWFSCFWWAIFQLVRNKEVNCNDAIHFCPVCNFKIQEYSAC